MENFTATVEEVVPVLPPGLFPARFAKIEVQSNDNGEFWLWTFVARNGDDDVEITATTSPRITPKTKAGKWISAMLGHQVEIGESIAFVDLIDMPMQIVVTINDAGYSRIDSLIPYSNSKK